MASPSRRASLSSRAFTSVWTARPGGIAARAAATDAAYMVSLFATGRNAIDFISSLFLSHGQAEETTLLDVVYIAIGVAAFVATVLYLPACDRL